MIYKIYVGPTFSVFLEHHVWEQNFMFIYVWDKELENTYTVCCTFAQSIGQNSKLLFSINVFK